MNAIESGTHLAGNNTVHYNVWHGVESTGGSAPIIYHTNLNIQMFPHPAMSAMGSGHMG